MSEALRMRQTLPFATALPEFGSRKTGSRKPESSEKYVHVAVANQRSGTLSSSASRLSPWNVPGGFSIRPVPGYTKPEQLAEIAVEDGRHALLAGTREHGTQALQPTQVAEHRIGLLDPLEWQPAGAARHARIALPDDQPLALVVDDNG